MANSKQARKRAIQAVARNKHLSAQRSRYRTAIKNVRKAILAGDKAAAQTLYVTAQSVIDSMADKGVLHKNAAARHKSRLVVAIKAMANQSFLLCFTLKQSKDSKARENLPGFLLYKITKTIGKNINCLIIFDSSL